MLCSNQMCLLMYLEFSYETSETTCCRVFLASIKTFEKWHDDKGTEDIGLNITIASESPQHQANHRLSLPTALVREQSGTFSLAIRKHLRQSPQLKDLGSRQRFKLLRTQQEQSICPPIFKRILRACCFPGGVRDKKQYASLRCTLSETKAKQTLRPATHHRSCCPVHLLRTRYHIAVQVTLLQIHSITCISTLKWRQSRDYAVSIFCVLSLDNLDGQKSFDAGASASLIA